MGSHRMSDVFISYARSTAKQAQTVAEALRAHGYSVWIDDDLPAHRAYSRVIEEQMTAAKVAVVIWSADAVQSEWVMSEANRAREDRKLVQVSTDKARLPMPFDTIQCADLAGWTGDLGAPGWRKVVASVGDLVGAAPPAAAAPIAARRRLSVCVLPFANMSGDPEQEYFSDGISEDIILTDLSKVSALSVVARSTAFTFKSKAIDVPQVARHLNVSHVLEGSVRKAGGRVRVTAQLIDGVGGDHIWGERWDRELTDIFALQDEISQAVVAALKLKLLPDEKKAIERRGTKNVDAYNLYLKARQYLVGGNTHGMGVAETIVRLCRTAIQIDPDYAPAWALMAWAQTSLHFVGGRSADGLEAAERALSLDPGLAEARAVRARHIYREGRHAEAFAEIEIALRLDPESHEVVSSAAVLNFREGRLKDAIRYWEKASVLAEADFGSAGMLITCYAAIGDVEATARAARTSLARVEKALSQDPSNGSAMSFGVSALAALGEAERAREWIDRALLIDPGNMTMRYNLACALATEI